MRTEIATLIIVFLSTACSAKEIVEMPPFPDPPVDWKPFIRSTPSGTICPKLTGVYSQPPLINRSGKEASFTPKDISGLYSSYIPFHLGDREEMKVNNIGLTSDHFVIRQPDTSQFYFMYLNEYSGSLVEYHFQSREGDFECRDGYMEFPHFTTYGMIEGKTANFQIRNILIKDEGGALVIQSTRGPYRGSLANGIGEFTFEFFQYPIVEDNNGQTSDK